MQICCPLRDEMEGRSLQDAIDQSGVVTKHYDWFAFVNKYFRSKIMRTSLMLTEFLPISDPFIKQKYYCITVPPFWRVCASENRLGQTVQTGQQTLGHLELFLDYVRWPMPN